MKTNTLFVLICLSLLATAFYAQTPSPIPEEARKHFVMGTTLFKDAKTADDYAEVVSEFKQAMDLAPQWPEARYNLALAREAAGDYSGAMEDLKLYQKFKLSDTEARTIQDKIYALEAKQKKKVSDEAAKAAADAASRQAQAAADAAREKARQPHFEGTWDLNGGGIIIKLDSSGNYTVNSADSSSTNTYTFTNFKINGREISFTEEFGMGEKGKNYRQRLSYDLTLSDDGEKLDGSALVYYYETGNSFNNPRSGTRRH